MKVKAVALNHLDVWVRKGWPGLKLELPHVLGSDIAGVVDAVGAEVTDLPLGTEVLVNPGLSCGVCERCLKRRGQPLPPVQIIGEHTARRLRGATSACRGRTSCPSRRTCPSSRPRACRSPSSPRGRCWCAAPSCSRARRCWCTPPARAWAAPAVQIAKLLGATVIATASTDEKLAKAKELGADHLINYANARLRRRGEAPHPASKLVDVVFEHVGASTWEKSVACLPYGGRLVTCGATTGYEVKLDLRVLFFKRISLLGSTMGSKGELFRVLAAGRGRAAQAGARPHPAAGEGRRGAPAAQQIARASATSCSSPEGGPMPALLRRRRRSHSDREDTAAP